MDLRKYASLAAEAARVEWARRRGLATMPYKLDLFTTFACNSRCRTCDIWKRYREDPGARERELTAAEIAAVVRSARDHLRWISLTGGEVTERPDFVEVVRGVMEASGGRLALINVTTNGLDPVRTARVFPEVFRLTRGTSVYATVSLEADEGSYLRVRGVRGGLTRARASLDAIRRAAEGEPHVMTGYQVTLSCLNAGLPRSPIDDPSLAAHSAIVGVASEAHTLTRGRIDVDARKARDVVGPAVERLYSRLGVRAPRDLPPKVYLGLARGYLKTGRSPLPCTAGWGALTVDAYGNVYQCFHRSEPLARLRDHDLNLARLCASEEFSRHLAPLRDCRECWSPCQAFPTMFQQPGGTAMAYLRSLMGWTRDV
jgi:MoaA/NifB/PqqE/SkfB family radical SAM enzyme